MIKGKSRISQTVYDKLPSWFSIQDLIFLADTTTPEVKLLVEKLFIQKDKGVYEDSTAFGKIPKISKDNGLKYFDLTSSKFIYKLNDLTWRELIHNMSDEYNLALLAAGNKETLSMAKALRQITDNKRISIANKKSEENLVESTDVNKTFTKFCAIVDSVLDECATILPGKLSGQTEDEMEETITSWIEKSKKRLRGDNFEGS